MADLFENERLFLNSTKEYLASCKSKDNELLSNYTEVVTNYNTLLSHLIRVTSVSDKMAKQINTLYNEMQTLAITDELTKMYNRRYLYDTFERCILFAKRNNSPTSALMIDIDYFKSYNDFYGHLIGDQTLSKVADIITSCLSRPFDFASRYGGEEFFIVLCDMDQNGAQSIANRIIKTVETEKMAHEKSSISKYITVSIGITSSNGSENTTVHDYIASSDKALYEAKSSGRNRSIYIPV